jgi:GT2 family glycosyltransferase
MRASVAVSTYQRAAALPRLVAALEAQTLGPEGFEVVICDNGSTDETARVLGELAARTPLRLRVVRVERNRGPAAGRNAAWRAARAPVVAFTDDDCLPTPRWLDAGLAAMGEARRIVVGRTLPNPEQLSRRGPFSLTVTVEDVRFFHTCNVFYRREDLEAVGGFDEGFRTPGGEDTDLGLRVRALGAEPAFAPEALVYHDVSPSSLAAVLRQTLRWTDIPRFFRKHPEARRDLLVGRLFWKPSHPRVIAAAGGLLAAAAAAPTAPAAAGALVLGLPWLWFRVRRRPLAEGPRRRWLVLPGAFAVDLLEVGVMLAGSLRHRALVL